MSRSTYKVTSFVDFAPYRETFKKFERFLNRFRKDLNDPQRVGPLSVADPGFSPGGGANSQKCYYFSIFCRKLHENERIWTPRGGTRPWHPPLDPPMTI